MLKTRSHIDEYSIEIVWNQFRVIVTDNASNLKALDCTAHDLALVQKSLVCDLLFRQIQFHHSESFHLKHRKNFLKTVKNSSVNNQLKTRDKKLLRDGTRIYDMYKSLITMSHSKRIDSVQVHLNSLR